MSDGTNHRRREILKTTGGIVGLGLLAGCSSGSSGGSGGNSSGGGGSGGGNNGSSGGGNGGNSGGGSSPYQLNAAGADQGSGTYGWTTAMQSATSKYLNDVDMTVQATQGSVASLQQLAQGDFDFGITPSFQLKDHLSKVDTSVTPQQSWQFSVAHQYALTFPGMTDKTIDTWADLQGTNFWAYSPGFSGFTTTKEVMQKVGYWDSINRIPVGTSDIVGAIQEGRVDAAVAFGINFVSLVPWLTELDSLDIEIKAVPMNQKVKDAIKSIDGLPYRQSDPYGWENHDLSGPLDTYVLASQSWLHPRVPEDVGYKMVKMAHERGKALRKIDPSMLHYDEKPKLLYRDLPSEDLFPFHPGVKKYLKEQDFWPVPADQ